MKGIEDTIKAVRQYKQYVERQIGTILTALADEGVKICRSEALSLQIKDTGKLIDGINGYTDLKQGKAVILVDCNYALFVEFGTGVRGKDSGYVGEAMSKTAYKHMGGTHYVTLQDGRVGWFYPTKDGRYRFTEGQPSRPFVYNTVKRLEELIRSL